MNPGLRGDDLLLNTGQELLALGQVLSGLAPPPWPTKVGFS
jgi:hypothetical protein